jgi:hypothetical protein
MTGQCVRRLLALGFAALGALAFGIWGLPTTAGAIAVIYVGYPVICACWVGFAWYAGRELWGIDWRSQSRRAWVSSSALAAVATVFLWSQEPARFKIVHDEVILATTAQLMHYDRLAGTSGEADYEMGSFLLQGAVLDKRPLAFPFLVSVVHDLTGYRWTNGFYLNGVLTFALLMLSWVLARRWSDERGGLLAILLWATLPLLGINSSSGLFEVLNLVLVLSVLLLGDHWLRNPQRGPLLALVFGTLVLAQTRYESALLVLPVIVMIAVGWWRRRAVLAPWPLYCAPLLLVPYLWQYRFSSAVPGFWQEGPGGRTTVFSVGYVGENLGWAVEYLLQFGQQGSNSLLLAVLGVAALGGWLVIAWQRRAALPALIADHAAPLLMLGGLALIGGVLLTYYWTAIHWYIAERFALPLYLVWVLAVPVVVHRLGIRYVVGALILGLALVSNHLAALDGAALIENGLHSGLLALAAAGVVWTAYRHSWPPTVTLCGLVLAWLLLVTVPVVRNHRYSQSHGPAAKVQSELEFLASRSNERLLWVSTTPRTAVLSSQAATYLQALKESPAAVARHMARQNYAAIYIAQELVRRHADAPFEPRRGHELDPAIFRTEVVHERPHSIFGTLRVLRLLEIKVPPQLAVDVTPATPSNDNP